jgi:hypothetical protein
MESIEQGREPTPARPRVRLGVIVAGIALVGLAALAWALDGLWRDRTTAELTRAFDETVTAIEAGERQVNSVIEYAPPDSTDGTQEDAVRSAAVDAAAKITTARDRIDAIVILPWHDELLTARDEADTWLALRATGITSLAEQGRAIYPPQGELDDARAALVGAFSALR